MEMLENFEINDNAPRYKERAFAFALPFQGRLQLLTVPPLFVGKSVACRLLTQFAIRGIPRRVVAVTRRTIPIAL